MSNSRTHTTVFLPTFNGEKYLRDILTAVFNQRVERPFEVLIIDSGSTDGTLDIIRDFPEIRLIEIPNSEFQHGRTRNLAAAKAAGEIVVFLTQSGTPATSSWLSNLTRHFDDESVVAAYGKHLARPWCNPYVAHDIGEAFRWISPQDEVLHDRLEPGESIDRLPGSERDRRRFFSNANSAVRKSFLQKNPFQEVEYAEDQLLGVDVLNAGLTKVYDPDATVLHSHSYPLGKYLRRRFDEYWGLVQTGEIRTRTSSLRLAGNAFRRWRRVLPWLWRSPSYSVPRRIAWSVGTLAFGAADALAHRLAQAAVSRPGLRRRLSLEVLERGDSSISMPQLKRPESRIGNASAAARMGLTVLFEEGPRQMIKKTAAYIRHGSSRRHARRSGAASRLPYSFVTENPPAKDFVEQPLPEGPLRIAWIIPDFGIGSGGHMNIFRAVRGLERAGHGNDIYIMGETAWKRGEDARNAIREHFAPIEARVTLGIEAIEASDVCFATSWQTAYPVSSLTNTRKKIYFVQDWEALFFPRGTEYALAEATYRFGFPCLTGGPWLAKKLRDEFDLRAEHFTFAYDPKIYNRKPLLRQQSPSSVLFYARPPTARRAFDLGLLALQLLMERQPEIEIGMFGWDCSDQNIPFDYVNHGILNDRDLARLYNTYQIGFVCSLTNYSLVTQEMLACGMAVVDIDAEHTRACYDEGAVVLAEPNPWDIADKLERLVEDPEHREQTRRRAEQSARALGGWQNQFARIEELIRTL